MRNLIIVLVLCLAGYWAYEKYWVTGPGDNSASELWNSQTDPVPVFFLPDRLIWQQSTHSERNDVRTAEIILIDGNRWRTESRVLPSSPISVHVFDGYRLTSSGPATTLLIPAPSMRSMLSTLSQLQPSAVGFRDGHSCWLFRKPPDAEGTRCDIWVGKDTHFPVLVEEVLASGDRGKIHYHSFAYDDFISTLHSGFAQRPWISVTPEQLWNRSFDTQENAPLFAFFITPVTAPQPDDFR